MKTSPGRIQHFAKRVIVVILLAMLGTCVLAVTYPMIAGSSGGNLAGY